jgi:hypothetical protein
VGHCERMWALTTRRQVEEYYKKKNPGIADRAHVGGGSGKIEKPEIYIEAERG